jgi:hypothetical protein
MIIAVERCQRGGNGGEAKRVSFSGREARLDARVAASDITVTFLSALSLLFTL